MLVASAMVCLVVANEEQVAEQNAADIAGTQVENGLSEQIGHVASDAGKNANKVVEQSKPALDKIGQSLGKMFSSIREGSQNIRGSVEAFRNNENVKKGYGFLKHNYDTAVGEAGKRIKPIVNSGVEKTRPFLEKVGQKLYSKISQSRHQQPSEEQQSEKTSEQ